MLKPLEVKEDICWVGSLDYDIKVFDIIMRTDYGTTYNAYVVKGNEKTVLIEISKEGFFEEFFERLKGVVDPAEIDYIIMNHTEPDHTGSLFKILQFCPKAVLVGTSTALRFIKEILNKDDVPSLAVSDGDSLDIGGKTLKFITAPLLHWPDTMFTYIPESAALFSCDSFGCHYCDSKVFNDLIEGDFYDAYKYYFDNIMGPFKGSVASALKKIESLKIDVICNGHGPVIRTNPGKYIGYYSQWSKPAKNEKPSVAIIYVTAYGYTKELATKIAEGVNSISGIDVKSFDITGADEAEAISALQSSDGFILGSPTLVGDALPPIYNALAHLNPIIDKGKLAGAFGSYGWSGEAVPNIEARLRQLRLKMPVQGLKVLFKPNDEDLKKAFEYGALFAEALIGKN
ncbi:MAG: FprA family A-type flavoprotein [Clostridiales bacterium]|jgi:flavorubredoxin|nr:FprA family A-type flavoprotein [Clostridiales bacterium]